MKRSPIRIGLVLLGYLAAGAVVNVVVAAGCALWMPLSESFARTHNHLPAFAERWTPRDWLDGTFNGHPLSDRDWWTVKASEQRGMGVSFLDIHGMLMSYDSLTDFQSTKRVIVERVGWPLRCLESGCGVVDTNPLKATVGSTVRAEFVPVVYVVRSTELRRYTTVSHYPRIDIRIADRNFIPLSPVWPAMIANTIVWALLLAVLVRGPRWVRGELRMRRGLCRSCGYPIGVADRCTECGHAFPKWLVRVRMPEGAAAPSGTSPVEKQIDREVA